MLRRECKVCSAKLGKRNKYGYCVAHYQQTNERKAVAKKNAAKRDLSGSNNPRFTGALKTFVCRCGNTFDRRPSAVQNTKFCSLKCKYKWSISISKRVEYAGVVFRSKWEAEFAKLLDQRNIEWQYEPEAFETPFGFYTPDFYLPQKKLYVEIKGVFRDQNSKDKFMYFKQTCKTKVVLLQQKRLQAIGLILKRGRNLVAPSIGAV